MPRKPRRIEPGVHYHIISRFVDREWFIRATNEREHYLKLLGLSLEDSDWRLTSFAVMSNHTHLSGIAGTQPLDAWIRRVHAPFADAMNRAYNRIGSMFVRGPKLYAVAPESFRHLLAYIHNNPVRAGVCRTAAESDWTSHRAYIGAARSPAWLHVSEGLARAGFDDRNCFDAWVNDPSRANTDAYFTEEHYERVLESARETGLVLHASARQRTAETIVIATADILGITVEQIRSTTRDRPEVLARTIAVRCAAAAGISGSAIASALHLSQQRVSLLRHQPSSREVRSLCAEVTRRIQTTGSRPSPLLGFRTLQATSIANDGASSVELVVRGSVAAREYASRSSGV